MFGSRIHRRSLSLLAADRYFDPFDVLLFHARPCRFRGLPGSLLESFESTGKWFRERLSLALERRVASSLGAQRSRFVEAFTAGRLQEKGKTPGRFSLRARPCKDTAAR